MTRPAPTNGTVPRQVGMTGEYDFNVTLEADSIQAVFSAVPHNKSDRSHRWMFRPRRPCALQRQRVARDAVGLEDAAGMRLEKGGDGAAGSSPIVFFIKLINGAEQKLDPTAASSLGSIRSAALPALLSGAQGLPR